MVNTARAKAPLCDFKAATFTQQQVAGRYAHVFEQYFHVTVRRIVITKDRQRPQHLDAGGVAGRPRRKTTTCGR